MSISYGFGLADGTTWIKPFLFLCLNMMYQTMDVSFPIQTIHKTPILSSITSGNGFSFPMHKRKYDKKRNQTIQIIGETVFFDSLFMFGVILSPSNYFHELIRKSNQKHILVPISIHPDNQREKSASEFGLSKQRKTTWIVIALQSMDLFFQFSRTYNRKSNE